MQISISLRPIWFTKWISEPSEILYQEPLLEKQKKKEKQKILKEIFPNSITIDHWDFT